MQNVKGVADVYPALMLAVEPARLAWLDIAEQHVQVRKYHLSDSRHVDRAVIKIQELSNLGIYPYSKIPQRKKWVGKCCELAFCQHGASTLLLHTWEPQNPTVFNLGKQCVASWTALLRFTRGVTS